MRFIITWLLLGAFAMTLVAELLHLTAAITSALGTVSMAVALVFVLTLVFDKSD